VQKGFFVLLLFVFFSFEFKGDDFTICSFESAVGVGVGIALGSAKFAFLFFCSQTRRLVVQVNTV
jgi:hypothetical protein